MKVAALGRWTATTGLLGGLLLLIGLLAGGCDVKIAPKMPAGLGTPGEGIPTFVPPTFAFATLGPLFPTTPTVPEGAPVVPGGPRVLPPAEPTLGADPAPTADDSGPAVGRMAPDLNLISLDTGKTVKLSSFRGHPVWINFWATWCPPCKEEMPVMQQVIAAHKDSDLVVLGVDAGEDADTVRSFVTAGHYTWTFALDPGSQTLFIYAVDGIPTHFWVDRQGVLRDTVAVGLSRADMETHLAAILK